MPEEQITQSTQTMQTSETGTRMRFIDVARGIGMICIVLGHLGVPEINRIVFTFHVPLFFLITGYFTDRNTPLLRFTLKKIRTLLLPYVVSCISIIGIAAAMNHYLEGGEGQQEVIAKWVAAALYGAGDSYKEPFVIYAIGATWFLLATFWGSMCLRILLEVPAAVRLCAVPAIFYLSCRSALEMYWFPLSIQAGGCALLFMYMGYLAREAVPAVLKLRLEIRAGLLCFAAWVWIRFMVDFERFWLVHCNYGRGPVDIFGSICGVSCVLFFSWVIDRYLPIIPFCLGYLGKYSLLMLCMHIIELDLFPWKKMITQHFGELPDEMILRYRIAGKFLWIIPLTILFSRLNLTRLLFGYKLLPRKWIQKLFAKKGQQDLSA